LSFSFTWFVRIATHLSSGVPIEEFLSFSYYDTGQSGGAK